MACTPCTVLSELPSSNAPKCAFEDGRFSPDNRGCGTIAAIRSAAAAHGEIRDHGEEVHAHLHTDVGRVIIAWPKGSNTAFEAVFLHDDEGVLPLSELHARVAIADPALAVAA